MSRSPLASFSGRSALVVAGSALLVLGPAVPAFATTPPTAASGLTVTVGDRFADLAWTDGDGIGAIVRDITSAATPYTPTSGRAVTVSSATTAHDTRYTNVGATKYAIWSTAGDGTPSSTALVQDAGPAAVVPTTLTLQVSHSRLPYGIAVTVAGTLTRTVGSAQGPVPGQTVNLYGVDGGTSRSVLLRHLTTDANGKVRTTLRPYRTLAMTLRFAGDAFSAASASPAATLRVLPRIGASVSPASIVAHETSVVSGRVAPAYRNARVVLQLFAAHAWHSQAETRTSSTGAYSFTVSPRVGVHPYRAVITGTPAWLAAGSAVSTLTVSARDLASGMNGEDVLALQRALQTLHYAPGSVNGSFGPDLFHAVIAFQKVERLPRTGRWTKAERVRLAHPTVWKVRYPSSGLAVDVDITRQVLVLSRNGAVLRIADLSSGGEYHYSYKGVSYVAHTPRGRFRVERKIDGVRISNLGYLYRPSYFTGGYAVHGEGYDVPATPASHGCVRVTNLNADYLFPLLVKGTPVNVFDE